MESSSPSGSPDSELAALRIISHIHTAAWGVIDIRRSIERVLPGDEALASSCEALLDVLDQADGGAWSEERIGADPGIIRGAGRLGPGIL